jgi:ABC-type amino acid transport system permease subunit
VHKFKNSSVILPISHEEKTKHVLFESSEILYIHYKTTRTKQYMFTICIEYIKVAFSLSAFLKELEKHIDRKMWITRIVSRLVQKK